jgi:hypothetical protein
MSRRDFRHFRAGDQTLSHDHRFAGLRPPSPASARAKPTFTGIASPAAAFHQAIHRRTFRQSAMDDIISTRESGVCAEFWLRRRGGRPAFCWCPVVRRRIW